MIVQKITRGEIIRTIQTYQKLQKNIKEDEMHYKDYTLFDYDEQKANIYKMRLDFDNAAMGRFLDEVI
jgi:hypothetical protein